VRRSTLLATAAGLLVPVALAVPGGQAGATGPTGQLFRIGHAAGEPTLGITRDGDIFVTASAGCVTSCVGSEETLQTVHPTGRAVMTTSDGGATWRDVSPGVPGTASTHVVSLDPYLFVDETPTGNRIFDVDLNLACSEVSYSDDGGATWVTNPVACGEPVNDHQTVFSGTPVTSPTVGYPKVVYYCFNHPAFTKCTKSLNGGLTFQPTAQVTAPECSGLNGHGVTNAQGWIFLPLSACGVPMLAVSKDEGDSWTVLQVASGHMPVGDPSVAIDALGNLYYVWVDNDWADRRAWVAVSGDSGATWGTPRAVSPAGVATNLATVAAGSPGNVAVAYYGTPGDFEDPATGWNGYLTAITGLLTTSPASYTVTVNDPAHPLKVNGCGPGRCGRVLDFIDVEVAPDGTPWGAYVDACLATCEATRVESIHDNDGVVGTMVGGPALR
jgi:hypothetical protein